jgi:hypothetical protein
MTSDGKGCHKSWLQQLEPESSEILRVESVTWTVPVTSIRAEQRSSKKSFSCNSEL